MASCKSTLENARTRHADEKSYKQYYGAYKEMRLDYFTNATALFVDEKMLRGDGYLKYFKCKWTDVQNKFREMPCRPQQSFLDNLPLESGKFAYVLEDEDGFYKEINETHKLTKGMITFDETRIMFKSSGLSMDYSGVNGERNPPGIDEGVGMAKYELVGLPKGNRAFDVENPMPHFKNMSVLLADEAHNLLEKHMTEMDYFFDDAIDKDTAYSLCYIPTVLNKMADHIDEVIHMGWEYEKEVLAPKRKREREEKIFNGIMIATNILFLAATALRLGGAAVAAVAERLASLGKSVRGLQAILAEATLAASRGAEFLEVTGTTLEAISGGGLVLGGGSMAGIISQDFPSERGTVLPEFFLALLFPMGFYALKAGRVMAGTGSRALSASKWKGFDMRADAAVLSKDIRVDLKRPGANPIVREHMGKFEIKLSPASSFCSLASEAGSLLGSVHDLTCLAGEVCEGNNAH
jgi:hypothetical protein